MKIVPLLLLVMLWAQLTPVRLTQQFCPPLSPPGGPTILVDSVSELVDAVNSAASGTTILVSDGTYSLNGAYLRLDTPGVTLRGASGDREAVVVDGDYLTTEIIQVAATDVTVADLTLREAYDHPMHVMSSVSADITGTLIYNVHIIDPGQQAIKINPIDTSHFPDQGVIACSRIELTDQGRSHIRDNCYTGGIDGHQARGWAVRDNTISGFWCTNGLSEHAIHFWRGSRETLVERNRLFDNARAIGFGLATSGPGRTYNDNPCPGAQGSYVDHYGGLIRDNFISAADAGLFASPSGFDCGICLWNACQVQASHNSVFSTQPPFSSIEWRFANTQVEITNNLTSYLLRERDGATAALSGNVTNAVAGWFVDAAGGDLHLVSNATSVIDSVSPLAAVTGDIDGDPRPVGVRADVGADEFSPRPPLSVFLPIMAR
jgi:hypothetical protein